MTESDFTFYKEQSPDETLRAYLDSHDNAYDRMRVAATRKFLGARLTLGSMNVLEVGCGGGIWSAFFATRTRSLTCCDIRGHVLESAKLHVSNTVGAERGSHIQWIEGDIIASPPAATFDFIFLKDVIEHIPDDHNFIACLRRLLKPNGSIYVATQNSNSLNFIIEGGYRRARGDKAWCGWDPTHVRFYNAATLEALASATGFHIGFWHGMYHVPYRFLSRLLLGRIVEHELLHLAERFGGARWPFAKTGWAIGALFELVEDAVTADPA